MLLSDYKYVFLEFKIYTFFRNHAAIVFNVLNQKILNVYYKKVLILIVLEKIQK